MIRLAKWQRQAKSSLGEMLFKNQVLIWFPVNQAMELLEMSSRRSDRKQMQYITTGATAPLQRNLGHLHQQLLLLLLLLWMRSSARGKGRGRARGHPHQKNK